MNFVEPLTPREKEVLDLLVEYGMTNKQLAEALVIAESTVERHLREIYRKIDASNRTQAVLIAIRHELVRSEEHS